MSWHDLQGGWAKGQQRRINGLIQSIPIFAFGLSIPFVAIRITQWFMPRLPSIALPAGLLWLMAGGGALILLLLLRRLHVERAIIRLVPESDGRICPRCRRSLTQLPDAGECPKCGQPYVVEILQRYWEAYALEPTTAGEWLLKMDAGRTDATKSFSLRRLHQLWFATRSRLDYMIASLLVFYLIASYFFALLLHVTFLGMFMKMLPYAFMMLGMSLISKGWRRRVGEERTCVACGYLQAPEGETAEQCPECGGSWRQPGGFHRGRNVRAPWMMFAGAMLLLGCLGLMSIDLIAPGFAPSMSIPPQELSTQALIETVMDPGAGFTTDEWTVLLSRTTTAEQELALAEGLLAFRRSRTHFDQDAEAWMHKKVKAKALPEDLVERYYREMLEASLVAPKQVNAGQPFKVSIACSPHTNLHSRKTGSDTLVVFFGGFYLDDSVEPVMRTSRVHYGGLFGSHAKYTPLATLTAETTGRVNTRAIFWMVTGDRDIDKGKIQWRPEGDPEIPAGASWVKRIELSQVIDVIE